MEIADQHFQPFLQHMRIYLRGRDIGVTEKRLYHAQVCAVMQKVAGKGMTQNMRTKSR